MSVLKRATSMGHVLFQLPPVGLGRMTEKEREDMWEMLVKEYDWHAFLIGPPDFVENVIFQR